MPFGLPNTVAAHQRLLRSILEAQEVRHCAVLAEVELALEDLPVPPKPPEAPGPGGLRGSTSSPRVAHFFGMR